MIRNKILSGEQLVAKGVTKLDASLPEIGVKDVMPDGSWLEQKQIQTALEARKHLIEVERIEKSGNLSHAEWQEELMLAKVTKKVGGYWQYVGHNVGGDLFLYPEEALFLLEVNNLHLMFNSVTVSLQQAYSLLLRGKVSLITYKVYSSLSRLGYRVFRYERSDISTNEQRDKHKEESGDIEVNFEINYNDNSEQSNNLIEINNIHDDVANEDKNVTEFDVSENLNKNENSTTKDISNNLQEESLKECTIQTTNETMCVETETMEVDSQETIAGECVSDHLQGKGYNKLKELQKRQKTKRLKDVHKSFEKFPNFIKKHLVTVNAPDSRFIPPNIVTKAIHLLDVEKISHSQNETQQSNLRTYNETDEVSGIHIRRVRNSSVHDHRANRNFPAHDHRGNRNSEGFFFNNRLPRQCFNTQFRPFNFWRSHNNFNYFYQRPYFPTFNYFNSRFQFFPRTPFYRTTNFHNNFGYTNYNHVNTPLHGYVNRHGNLKRRRSNSKGEHLDSVKSLAMRIKSLPPSPETSHHIRALLKIIQTFNIKYRTNVTLTEQLDLQEDDVPLETVELDDDDESNSKKPRSDDKNDTFNENLIKIKQLALKLKSLDDNNTFCAIHKRAINKLIKTFNKSYNGDVWMDSNYEIFDKKHITLDSSDSDCVIDEVPKERTVSKKLKNPFNIFKRILETQNAINGSNAPSTSKGLETVEETANVLMNIDNTYSESMVRNFKKWLPKEDDFGRAEISPLSILYFKLIDNKKEELLFNFLKNLPTECDSWVSLKISFWKNYEEATETFQNDVRDGISSLNSIIQPEHCTNMGSMLNKLRIIKTCQNVNQTCNLSLDFDVYNRNIQNFRKTNRPKPHFRVVTVDESSNFPSGNDVATIHSLLPNDTIVFAIVGTGSISYMQVNNFNLPIYIPHNDSQ